MQGATWYGEERPGALVETDNNFTQKWSNKSAADEDVWFGPTEEIVGPRPRLRPRPRPRPRLGERSRGRGAERAAGGAVARGGVGDETRPLAPRRARLPLPPPARVPLARAALVNRPGGPAGSCSQWLLLRARRAAWATARGAEACVSRVRRVWVWRRQGGDPHAGRGHRHRPRLVRRVRRAEARAGGRVEGGGRGGAVTPLSSSPPWWLSLAACSVGSESVCRVQHSQRRASRPPPSWPRRQNAPLAGRDRWAGHGAQSLGHHLYQGQSNTPPLDHRWASKRLERPSLASTNGSRRAARRAQLPRTQPIIAPPHT
jgi:hypothetical protein